MSNKCSATATELLAELEKFRTRKGDGWRKLLSTSVRAIRGKALLKETQTKLESYKRILDTRLIVRLDVRVLQQENNIQNLSQNVQNLIATLNQGHKTAAQILSALTSHTRIICDHMDQKFDDHARQESENAAQEQFKESLFFSEILARQEQIHDAHKGTCCWIFRSRNGNADINIDTDNGTDNGTEGESAGEEEADDEDESLRDSDEEVDSQDRKVSFDEDDIQYEGSNSDASSTDQPWPDFTDWLENGQDVYWISGKAGSGKSTLMAYIRSQQHRIEVHLARWAGPTDLVMVYYYFWNPGTEMQKNSQGLLRSLLYQILDQRPELTPLMLETSVGSKVATGTPANPTQMHMWTDRRLMNVLRGFLKRKPLSLSICFFIDGLDEFVDPQETLLDMIRLLVRTPQVKVCVSSRPEQIFRLEFLNSPQLSLQDFNRRDLEKIVRDKLKPILLRKFPHEENGVRHLLWAISDRAEGVFLWLDLMAHDMLNGIRNEDGLCELRRRLDNTPGSIDGLFKHMLNKLDKSYQDQARHYFSILVLTKELRLEPCTLLQFVCMEDDSWQHVLRNDQSYFISQAFSDLCATFETRIITRCAGLVEVQRIPKKTGPIAMAWRFPPEDVVLTARWDGQKDIWSHQRRICFIHRSASDLIRDHFADTFRSAQDYSAACLEYSRGVLGTMTLLPILITPRQYSTYKVYPCTSIPMLISSSMDALQAVGKHNTEPELPVLAEIDHMVELMFEYTHRLKQVMHEHGHPSSVIAKGHFLPPCWMRLGPFKDVIAFASYWGQQHYLKRHLLSQTNSLDELNQLLQITTYGLHWSRSTAIDATPYFEILEVLLHLGADPNMSVCIRLDEYVANIQLIASIWSIFIQLGQEIPDTRLWSKVFALFLSKGGDCNITLFTQSVVNRLNWMILEESLLSYIKRMAIRDEEGKFEDACAKLQQQNALERTHVRMMRSSYHLCERWYGLSETHSTRLLKESNYPHDYFGARSAFPSELDLPSSVINSILAELADADAVDLATLILKPLPH